MACSQAEGGGDCVTEIRPKAYAVVVEGQHGVEARY